MSRAHSEDVTNGGVSDAVTTDRPNPHPPACPDVPSPLRLPNGRNGQLCLCTSDATVDTVGYGPEVSAVPSASDI